MKEDWTEDETTRGIAEIIESVDKDTFRQMQKYEGMTDEKFKLNGAGFTGGSNS